MVHRCSIFRTLIEAEIELKGYISALHSLTTETEKLKDMAQRSYRERQELYTKHHKIQEFKDLTVGVIIKNCAASWETQLCGFRTGPTQTGLYCDGRWLEA